ncbi:MAG: hypothetical protein ACK5MT_21850 [Actinomycetales bacterium]
MIDDDLYGRGVANWTSWALPQPRITNPLTDPDGRRATGGQDDADLWFVGGGFGGAVQRSWQMPAGRRLFFPVAVRWLKWHFIAPKPRLDVQSWYASFDGDPIEPVDITMTKIPLEIREGSPAFDVDRDETFKVSVSGLWGLSPVVRPGEHELLFGWNDSQGFDLSVRCLVTAI